VATIKHVERQIELIEGFRVRIRYTPTGRDVRGDKAGIPGYSFRRQMAGSKNVKDWREGRFARLYPGFAVDVLTADDAIAHGGTLLSTLRAG
jgi:hypothetical protein